MAGPNRHKRFTIYDMMEAKGVFEANPANQDSRGEDGSALYSGPVQYPKMMYHPKGERVITVPAEVIVTPFGPKLVGQQTELVHKIVNSEKEERALVALGWHSHPSDAMAAAGETVAPRSAGSRIEELEALVASLQAQVKAGGAAADQSLSSLLGGAA